jgi:hypothetical protein
LKEVQIWIRQLAVVVLEELAAAAAGKASGDGDYVLATRGF